MSRSRQIRLVAVDEHGDVLGVTPFRSTNVAWWQETQPLRAGFPELFDENDPAGTHVVLRLLEAEHDSDAHMGGRSTHLVQTSLPTFERASDTIAFEPWSDPVDGVNEPEPLRHPWAEPGGPADDLAWVADHVDIAGRPVQHRTWNLSAIWSIPTPEGKVWLKCVPRFYQHEAAVLRVLAEVVPGAGPTLLAADGHRQLLAEMAGRDGYEATPEEQIAMVDALVDLQLAVLARTDDLLAAGVPDCRCACLLELLTSFLDRVAVDDGQLQRLKVELPDRLATLEALGLPDVLVHGDPHPGNSRLGADPPVWFDWGDSFIGNPLLDLGAVHRMAPQAIERWLYRWSEPAGGLDLTEAWTVLKPIALVRSAWVYQDFLDNIEPSERIYHREDVPLMLSEARHYLAAE